jgi:hypothetical protein
LPAEETAPLWVSPKRTAAVRTSKPAMRIIREKKKPPVIARGLLESSFITWVVTVSSR